MSVRARGQFVIKRLRARYRKVSDAQTYTVPFVGPYTELLASQPALDASLSGFPTDYKVKEVTVEEGRSIDGKMVVTIEKPLAGNTGSTEDSQIGDPVYESDYSEERRPIEEHNKCGNLDPGRPYYEYPDRKTSDANPGVDATTATNDAEKVYKQRTWDHWQSLDDNDYAAGDWNLADYKSLKEKGRNDYPVAYPVCTVTTYSKFRQTSGSGVWSISSPPAQCSPPSGWTYVKTGDRCTKQGRLYTRVQTWRGYDSTDTLFFL